MILNNNSKKLNESGDEITTIETTTSVNENECGDISKLKRKEYNKKYLREYRKTHKEYYKQYFKNYGKNNCEKLKKYRHNYHKENINDIHNKKCEYYQQNKSRIKQKNDINRPYRKVYNKYYYEQNKTDIMDAACIRTKKRYHTDALFKTKMLLRGRLYDICKRKNIIKPKTMALLGCDLKFFKTHIESLFLPGMSWDNHGKWGWHIDHIMPLESAKTSEDMKTLCHYKNLQPLWWYDNLSKGGTIPQMNKKL